MLDFETFVVYIVQAIMGNHRMLKQLPQAAFALVLFSSIALAGPIKDNSLAGSSNGNAITISWFSEDESGVIRYDVERRTGLGLPFSLLANVDTKGNNLEYVFVDESAFRTAETLYQYRVKVVYANGTTVDYGPITVSHKTSDVKRTWGSIKAMFR